MRQYSNWKNRQVGCKRKSKDYLAGSCLVLSLLLLALPQSVFGQLDQGAISGVVSDPQGAVVPHALVQLTNVDTNFVLETQTDSRGVYTFQPVKVGRYSLSVSAPGFSTSTKSGLDLHVSERLEANIPLKVGNTQETLQVSAENTQLLQTEDASTGQVMTTREINDMPLNQRNYVFVAQLAAGITASNGSRGQGNGDFNANGQRATQNNFILDGVDNNSNAIDFLNGASYVVKPPPDALQEFKVQTGSFAAEFGHSAGGVVNASIKSGTNQFHGDAWEYLRNNDLGEALPAQWYSGTTKPTVLPYHQNQFGGTFGGPIFKNKLFFFGDYEGNRIVQQFPAIVTVPTLLERTGNFTELLNTNLTGSAQPITLYEPGSAGKKLLGSACGNAKNIMCAGEISSISQTLINLYPKPNANNGLTYNNYSTSRSYTDYTNQFDIRVDWNVSQKDQVFGRVSWAHENGFRAAVLGPILDGSGTDDDGTFINYGKNAVLSENHVFSPNLVNQLRFGYNWGYFSWFQQSYNANLAAQYGLGGIPFQSLNGGLPNIYINGVNSIGTPLFQPSPEHENVYQIIDDLTMIRGNHTFKFGFELQNIRYSVLQPTFAHSAPGYDGHFTGSPGVSYTGSGVADFLSDSMNSDYLSSFTQPNLGRWYHSFYGQDDWKISRRVTLNLGLRYDFFQPPIERHDHQGLFYPTDGISVPAGGTGVFMLPSSQKGVALDSTFLSLLAKDNIQLQYSGNRSLVLSQKTNFAPRVGISWQATNRLVVRLGSGLFYGGLENLGNYPNLGVNYPYDVEQFWGAPSCTAGLTSCVTNGATLKSGPPSGGLSLPTLTGQDPKWHSPYSIEYNVSTEYALANHMSLTVGYVGSVSRHLPVVVWPNSSAALAPSGTNTQSLQPFPDFGGFHTITEAAIGNYNGLQATLQRQFNNGLSFLSSYTWSHALDDAREPLPSSGEGGDRNYNILGLGPDYSSSPFDARQRFTFTGTYDLPFGAGRRYLNKNGVWNILAGGWSSTMIFRAQTGQPFTVYASGAIDPSTGALRSGIAGASYFAVKVGDPWKGGGTSSASNGGITCPAKVRITAHWYNPCAFADPVYPASFGSKGYLTGSGVLQYLGAPRGQIADPGYERIDMSVFKNFTTFEKQYLQFRADVFNLFNTPTWGIPSDAGIASNAAGHITGTRTLGNYTPDARFFQLALKYYF